MPIESELARAGDAGVANIKTVINYPEDGSGVGVVDQGAYGGPDLQFVTDEFGDLPITEWSPCISTAEQANCIRELPTYTVLNTGGADSTTTRLYFYDVDQTDNEAARHGQYRFPLVDSVDKFNSNFNWIGNTLCSVVPDPVPSFIDPMDGPISQCDIGNIPHNQQGDAPVHIIMNLRFDAEPSINQWGHYAYGSRLGMRLRSMSPGGEVPDGNNSSSVYCSDCNDGRIITFIGEGVTNLRISLHSQPGWVWCTTTTCTRQIIVMIENTTVGTTVPVVVWNGNDGSPGKLGTLVGVHVVDANNNITQVLGFDPATEYYDFAAQSQLPSSSVTSWQNPSVSNWKNVTYGTLRYLRFTYEFRRDDGLPMHQDATYAFEVMPVGWQEGNRVNNRLVVQEAFP